MSAKTYKAVFIAASSRSFINFRFDLMQSIRPYVKSIYPNDCVDIVALAPFDKDFLEVKYILNQAHITLKAITLNNIGMNIMSDLRTLYKLWSILRHERPDILILATIKPVIYSLFVSYFLKIPHKIALMTGLGHVYTDQKWSSIGLRMFTNILYKFTLNRAQHVFFQNCDDQNYFIKNRLINPHRTSITPGSGVNLTKFIHTPLTSTPPVRFLFIGRLLKTKGIVEYCQAAGLVKSKFSHATFQVVGGYHNNPAYLTNSIIQKLFLEFNIEYLGERSDILSILQQAHVVVLPSYREGVPKSLLEALAVGRAIITTDVPGCRETVTDGYNGYLVSPQNHSALAQAMCKLLKYDDIALMGNNSRSLAEQKFDVNLVNNLILNKIFLN